MKKMLLATALTLGATGATQAADINVGGVIWDPDYNTATSGDLIVENALLQWWVDPVDAASAGGFFDMSAALDISIAPPPNGSVLQGVGEIDRLNGRTADPSSPTGGSATSFCPGCELTFTFGGLELTGVDGSGAPTFDLSGAFLNVFVDHTGAFFDNTAVNGQADVDAATNGTLWLDLSFDQVTADSGFTFLDGSLSSLLSVIGGLAEGNFDTNTQLLGADLLNTSSVQFDNGTFGEGTGEITGDTIPEPGSLALMGLGLLGAGWATRRASQKKVL